MAANDSPSVPPCTHPGCGAPAAFRPVACVPCLEGAEAAVALVDLPLLVCPAHRVSGAGVRALSGSTLTALHREHPEARLDRGWIAHVPLRRSRLAAVRQRRVLARRHLAGAGLRGRPASARPARAPVFTVRRPPRRGAAE